MVEEAPSQSQRAIRWWWAFPAAFGWAAVPIAFMLFLPKPMLADRTADAGFYVTARGLVWGVIVPAALGLIVPIVIISVLRWWPRVLKDSVPTARWVIAVPFLVAVPSLVFADYAALTAHGPVFFALFIVSVLLIATSEELMFRGLAVELLREGLAERWVALLSTALFAAAHAVNGGVGIPQILSAFVGGYLYYFTRRATRFLAFPILVHAAFDVFGFSLWSSAGDANFNMFVYQSAILVVVLVMSRLVAQRGITHTN
jgi:membrane protease YdiL (CAAX protease family)